MSRDTLGDGEDTLKYNVVQKYSTATCHSSCGIQCRYKATHRIQTDTSGIHLGYVRRPDTHSVPAPMRGVATANGGVPLGVEVPHPLRPFAFARFNKYSRTIETP